MKICLLCNNERRVFAKVAVCALCNICPCTDCERRLTSEPRTKERENAQKRIMENWDHIRRQHRECREHVSLVEE